MFGGFFKKKKQKRKEKTFYITSLRDLNHHFIGLSVNLEMASECIVTFAKRAQIDNQTIYKLLEDQENVKNANLRKQVLSLPINF